MKIFANESFVSSQPFRRLTQSLASTACECDSAVVLEAGSAQSDRLHEALFGDGCEVLAAVAAEDLAAAPAVVLPPAEPKLDLTVLTASDGVIRNPQLRELRVPLVNGLPRAVRVLRVAVDHGVL